MEINKQEYKGIYYNNNIINYIFKYNYNDDDDKDNVDDDDY